MGLETVAEHVEDEDTVTELQEIGLQHGQGFHLGRPAAMDDQLAALLGHDEIAARRGGGTAA